MTWLRMRAERGEVASWVMVTVMSAALVVAVWAIAHERLVAIVSNALSSVCGSIGC